MASDKKIIAVVGASGVQGSGVIYTILAHPILSQKFAIRALSRNTAALREKYGSSSNIEFEAVDLDSLPSLVTAFTGAHTVFGLTNYYETRNLERDVQQGKNITDACIKAGVEHLIWSSMRYAKDVSQGAIMSAPGLDGKAAVSEYTNQVRHTSSLNGGMKVTHLLVGFYYSNIPRIWGYENLNGQFEIKLPFHLTDVRVPFVDAAVDVGRFVAGVLVKADSDINSVDGRWIQVVSQWDTMQDVCNGWSKPTRHHEAIKPMSYEAISKQEFEDRLPYPLRIEQLGNLVEVINKHELFGFGTRERQHEDDALVHAAGLQKSSWADYVARDFDKDFADPMLPRFLYPYLVEIDAQKAELEKQKAMDVKGADRVVNETAGDVSPIK